MELEDEDLNDPTLFCPLHRPPDPKDPRRPRHEWTRAQEQILREEWPHKTIGQIADHLGVTKRIARYRASGLGLPNKGKRRK